MDTPSNLGFDVTVYFADGEQTVLHNVTEIHFGYPSTHDHRVAFESDIHHTGITYDLGKPYITPLAVREFEARIATELADWF